MPAKALFLQEPYYTASTGVQSSLYAGFWWGDTGLCWPCEGDLRLGVEAAKRCSSASGSTTQGPNDTLDQARHKISCSYKAARLALAFSEHELSKKTTFTKDIVEPDTSRLSGKKVGSPKGTLSSGRTICLVGRFARKWLVASLQPRLSRRGRGPEALREVKDVVTNAVDKSTILAPDGVPGWAGSARAADIPHLAGVSHGKKTFTTSQ